MIMRLATGMHVVPTAPEHRVGEHHYHSQVGYRSAQDSLSIPYDRHN
jgi:hypothetical protein